MRTLETINKIKEIATKNQNRHKSQKTRFVKESTRCFRQGDIYIFRVNDNHHVGQEVERNQLADGVSIGARHILNGNFRIYQGTTAPEGVNPVHARESIGYAFDVEESTVLAHPEHDNYVFKTCGRYQVIHQLDLRTLRRAAD
jgi:hypothetical protein